MVVDALPERCQYQDDGCEVSPSCLRCPLPRCKYDDPGWLNRRAREQRDGRILRVWLEGGTPVDSLARRFGVSERTVFRILATVRHKVEGGHAQPAGSGLPSGYEPIQ